MMIQELSRQASLELLARMRLGRLACAQGTQPYVVPFYFAYDDESLYGFSTVGQKIEWMRANPLVCVEADEVASPEQWASVVVFGRYEELPDTPEWQNARTLAHTLLKRSAVWWEPAYVKTVLHDTPRPLVPVFFRIHIVRITGHSAIPDPGAPPDDPGERGWRRALLRQVRRAFTQWPGPLASWPARREERRPPETRCAPGRGRLRRGPVAGAPSGRAAIATSRAPAAS
jgi:nitroimidazol reductase NimA-like FMN-containing flavoprotein (pyridoxamine 5'-phosphate oxidase superfamily)